MKLTQRCQAGPRTFALGEFFGGLRPRPFTLIELLVVIAIIAILASLLLPALQSAKERGQRTVCAGHERQLATIMLMYADDFDHRLPKVWEAGPGRWWYSDARGYFESTDILLCPRQKHVGFGYGYSKWLADNDGRYLKEVRFPDRSCFFNEIGVNVDRSWPWGYFAADTRFEPDPKHQNGCNMVFVDGHVSFLAAAWNNSGLHSPVAGSLSGTYWYPTDSAPPVP